MRKSDRIRILELEVVRLNYELEILRATVTAMLDKEFTLPELESGKWYNNKSNKNK